MVDWRQRRSNHDRRPIASMPPKGHAVFADYDKVVLQIEGSEPDILAAGTAAVPGPGVRPYLRSSPDLGRPPVLVMVAGR
jgi:hypothetical protein